MLLPRARPLLYSISSRHGSPIKLPAARSVATCYELWACDVMARVDPFEMTSARFDDSHRCHTYRIYVRGEQLRALQLTPAYNPLRILVSNFVDWCETPPAH